VVTVYYGAQMALGIAEKPFSAELTAECLAYADVNAAFLPPSIIEELSVTEEGIEPLMKLNYLGFSGGECLRREWGWEDRTLLTTSI
jgi:hypothetical protein